MGAPLTIKMWIDDHHPWRFWNKEILEYRTVAEVGLTVQVMTTLVLLGEVKQILLSVRSPLFIRCSLTFTMLYRFIPRDPSTSRMSPSLHYDIAQSSRWALWCLRWVWLILIRQKDEIKKDAWLNLTTISLQGGGGPQNWCVQAVWPEVSLKAGGWNESDLHICAKTPLLLPKTHSCYCGTFLISNLYSSSSGGLESDKSF